MQCVSPLTVDIKHIAGKRTITVLGRKLHFNKHEPGHDYSEVPCGHCVACRYNKAHKWAARLTHELIYWRDRALFITLTYDDAHCPKDNSLDKREFTLFWKRLRYAIEQGPQQDRCPYPRRKLKYYACGEYGETNLRPHYHAIVFGMDRKDRQTLINTWTDTETNAPRCEPWCITTTSFTYKRALYVSDYVLKAFAGQTWPTRHPRESYKDYLRRVYGGREPPFAVMSQGIGRRYALDHAEDLLHNRMITVEGRPTGIPRYYLTTLGEGGDTVKALALKITKEAWHKERTDGSITEINRSMRRSTEQREKDLLAKEKARGKKGQL